MAAAFTGGMADALNCFVAGTLVLTAAGLVAIEKIKVGDLVMSADENGNRGLKRVVRTFARQTESIVTVNAGEMAIRCTPEHPFFVEEKGFVYAGDLEAGNILVTEACGCVIVTSVEADENVNAENTVTVYNFEVEDWHTYFVGDDGVLVHNTCPADLAAAKGFEGIGTTENGGPNFSGTEYIYKLPDGTEATVPIKMTGDRRKDFNEASKAAGFTDYKWGKSPVDGYTWHHMDDYNPKTGECTMQLVTVEAHKSTYPHKGSCGQWDDANGKTYNKK